MDWCSMLSLSCWRQMQTSITTISWAKNRVTQVKLACFHLYTEFRPIARVTAINSTNHDSRNKKSTNHVSGDCAGVGTAAGWVYPVSQLIGDGSMPIVQCNVPVKSAAAYFGNMCAPNALTKYYNPFGKCSFVYYGEQVLQCQSSFYNYLRSVWAAARKKSFTLDCTCSFFCVIQVTTPWRCVRTAKVPISRSSARVTTRMPTTKERSTALRRAAVTWHSSDTTPLMTCSMLRLLCSQQ